MNSIRFREQLRQEGLPSCPGAVTGICDTAIAAWIGNRLERPAPDPALMYWVTLNSHLPVPTPVPIESVVPCSALPLPSQSPALCSWTELELNVHQSIAALASRDLPRPTVFIIVGDHAPPFSDPNLRQQFSRSVVPYILLTPASRSVSEEPLHR